jgi:DNA-directed RNA polymerase specialized sigma24 family protein
MSAQPQYLPILGSIDLMPPEPVTFKGISRLKDESIEEAAASGSKERIAVAISKFLSNLYPNAPYLQGAKGGNYELTDAVVMKYFRSRPDWEPTEELPALKPTITDHKLIKHWLRMVAKRTHIDLCREHEIHRAHYVLATDLIPAGAEDFNGLEWGGAESTNDAVCEVGISKIASFYKIKPTDWYQVRRRSDAKHPLPNSCRAWSYVVPIKGKQDVALEPLNNPMFAGSASKPFTRGQQYKVWPEEAYVILGQVLSRLAPEERALIRKGWESADYDSDFEKLLKRLLKLNTPRVSQGINWTIKLLRSIVESAGGLTALYDEYAGWNKPLVVSWNNRLSDSRNNMLSALAPNRGSRGGRSRSRVL